MRRGAGEKKGGPRSAARPGKAEKFRLRLELQADATLDLPAGVGVVHRDQRCGRDVHRTVRIQRIRRLEQLANEEFKTNTSVIPW